MNKSKNTGYWLLATGYWILVSGQMKFCVDYKNLGKLG